MKLSTLASGILSIVALMGMVTFDATAATSPERINVIGGANGGKWYLSMGVVCKEMGLAFPNAKVNLLPGGSTSNPIRLDKKDGEISITQHTMAVAATKGTAPFKKPSTNCASIMNMRDISRLQIVVRADFPFKTLDEIRDKKFPLRVGHGPIGSTGELFGRWVFEEAGMSWKTIRSWGGKMYSNSYDDLAAMLKDNQLDMILWTGAGEGGHIRDAATSLDLRWLPVSEEVIKGVAKYGLGKGFMPKALYDGKVRTDVPCVTDTSEIIIRRDLPDDTVYAIVKQLIEKWDEVTLAVPDWKTFDPATGWKDLGFELHPGAAKYYKEKGYMK